MRKRLPLAPIVVVLLVVLLVATLVYFNATTSSATGSTSSTTDYPGAIWMPANPNNYSSSNRTEIYWIVMHVAEGSALSAANWFQNPNAKASAHYIVGYDGTIYQSVREKDIAWHAGNRKYNLYAIGIELEGYTYKGDFTDAEYKAAAKLVAYLCKKYNVPIYHPDGVAPADPTQGKGIIGHIQVPDPYNPSIGGGASHHTDPGPYFNWNYFLNLVKQYYYRSEGS